MAKLEIDISPAAVGPIADGTAGDILHEWLNDAKRHIADYAVRQLRATAMDKTGRATGHYQQEIKTDLLGYGDLLIRDPVVYGPWLEGTSQRNRSTRFKGYHLWRNARDVTQREAGRIAEELLPPYLERMGGS